MSRDAATTKIVNGVLAVMAAGAVVTLPGLAVALDAGLKHYKRHERQKELKRIMHYMVRKDLIDFRELATGEISYRVNEKGSLRAKKARFEELVVPKLKTWDGMWRLVMFDVPEKRRENRRALSNKLHEMGFFCLQKSVWVYPYPCQEQIEIIRVVYELKRQDIIIAEVSNIDYGYKLRKRFNLT